MPTSIKKNFVLNLFNTVTGLLFPIITFPYASRILFAEGIGQIQFFQSIVDYIMLCTSLGIPLYAVREIARIRDNDLLRTKVTVEILLLHALLTLIGYGVVFVLIHLVAKIQVDIPLFLLLSTALLFNAIGVAWFYQGVEDFKYITIRTLLVRLFSLVSLFLFVKDKEDLFFYAAITVVANVGGNIFNFIRLRTYLKGSLLKGTELRPFKHLVPALRIFVLNLIISIYVNLDSVMLGFLKNDQSIGYYAAATRLTKAILGIVSSFGMVLLPRFSYMLGNNQMDEFKVMANKAVSFVIAVSLPLCIGLIFMANPIILLFCGVHFEPSILTLRFVAPIIIFIGLSGIMGMQILYPQGKERLVIISTLSGAIVNFCLNYLLIPSYAQYGAAIATFFAELSVTGIMIVIGYKYLPIRFFTRQNMQYGISSLVVTVILIILRYLILDDYMYLLIGIIISVPTYCGCLYYTKDPFLLQLLQLIENKLRR